MAQLKIPKYAGGISVSLSFKSNKVIKNYNEKYLTQKVREVLKEHFNNGFDVTVSCNAIYNSNFERWEGTCNIKQTNYIWYVYP